MQITLDNYQGLSYTTDVININLNGKDKTMQRQTKYYVSQEHAAGIRRLSPYYQTQQEAELEFNRIQQFYPVVLLRAILPDNRTRTTLSTGGNPQLR
jgi:hypothetical protein